LRTIMQQIQHENGEPLTLEEWENTFGYNPLDLPDVRYDDHPRVGDANVAGRLYSIREGDDVDQDTDWTVEQGWCLVNILHRFIITEKVEREHHRQ
jgi:hypothetical protein